MTTKTKRYTAAYVLATEWCEDVADMADRRYHYGHTTRPMYTCGDYYWCAMPIGQKPAQLTGTPKEQHWTWGTHESAFAASIGWQIWKSHMNA